MHSYLEVCIPCEMEDLASSLSTDLVPSDVFSSISLSSPLSTDPEIRNTFKIEVLCVLNHIAKSETHTTH